MRSEKAATVCYRSSLKKKRQLRASSQISRPNSRPREHRRPSQCRTSGAEGMGPGRQRRHAHDPAEYASLIGVFFDKVGFYPECFLEGRCQPLAYSSLRVLEISMVMHHSRRLLLN